MRSVLECANGAKMRALPEGVWPREGGDDMKPPPLLLESLVAYWGVVLLLLEVEDEGVGEHTIMGPWVRSEAPDAQGIPDVMRAEAKRRSDFTAVWPSASAR